MGCPVLWAEICAQKMDGKKQPTHRVTVMIELGVFLCGAFRLDTPYEGIRSIENCPVPVRVCGIFKNKHGVHGRLKGLRRHTRH